MCYRSLPNYDAYRHKIAMYAKANRVRIVYSEHCSSLASYTPALRQITLETDLEESQEIAVLLHELGHAMDDDSRLSLVEDRKLDAAVRACHSDRGCTPEQYKLVIKCERTAWAQAEVIAKKKLKIRLGVWFYKERKTSLHCYRINTKIIRKGT